MTSTSTYRYDPSTEAVAVESTYLMTNTTRRSPERESDRLLLLRRHSRSGPGRGRATVVVEVDGRLVEFDLHPETRLHVVDVEFPSNLRYGRTATIVVRYDLLGDPPRTETSLVRVNPAYVPFPLIAFGDAG